jgi:hypothetical protein
LPLSGIPLRRFTAIQRAIRQFTFNSSKGASMNRKASRISFIHTAMALMLGTVLLPIADALAANGYAVTVRWRYDCSGWTSTFVESLDADMCQGLERGTLVRFTIQNNKVVKCDTLIPFTTALCQYPAINLDGTKIAFFRWGCVVGKDASGKDALLNQNLPGKISVVDIDGKNLRDMVDLPFKPCYDEALDWASDGWIYYIKPRTGGDAFSRNGNELWKVNPYAANPASTNQLVFADPDCGYMRRFSISQDATRMAQQAYPLGGNSCPPCPYVCGTTLAQCFPPKAINDCFITSIGSCNAKISPSGLFGGGFGAGWHDWTEIRSLTPPYNTPVACGPTTSTGWRCCIPSAMRWAGFSFAGGTGGVEQLCFSANSDKWVCEDVMPQDNYKRGKVQFIINWVDTTAICTTPTPDANGNPVRGTVTHCAFTGDFWVQPPAGTDYAYEDTLGKWHLLPRPPYITRVQSGSSLSSSCAEKLKIRTDIAGSIRIELPAGSTYRVSFLDMQGRAALTRIARISLSLAHGSLRAGVYQVRAEKQGAGNLTAMMTIYH